MKERDVFIALGGNVGDVLDSFRKALAELEQRGLRVVGVSSAYRTRALTAEPSATAPDYWNAVVHARTEAPAREVLATLHAIEAALGRERRERWSPRTLDLDLLLYGARVVSEPGLSVPHPRMLERAFVLVPLAELAPDLVVPGTDRTVAAHTAALADPDAWILERRAGWR